jgi:hypothetical protein
MSLPNENTTVHAVVGSTGVPSSVDGQLLGLWRRDVGRAGITAHVRLLRPVNARQRREIEAAFTRYATFAGVPVTVVLG